jgi:hypothetical protein
MSVGRSLLKVAAGVGIGLVFGEVFGLFDNPDGNLHAPDMAPPDLGQHLGDITVLSDAGGFDAFEHLSHDEQSRIMHWES